jgi:large subunit ribosomal protein L17
MRHNVKGRKLGRTTEHRLALFRNQIASLVASGRIKTTLPKAKELRPIAEKLVTKGKRGSVEARRQVARWIPQRDLIKKLFDEVAPRFQERDGGYLRILKLGPRPGDGAEMAILEWVDYEVEGAAKKKKKPGKAEKADSAAPAKAAKSKKAAADDEPEEAEEVAKKAAPKKAAPKKAAPKKATSEKAAPKKAAAKPAAKKPAAKKAETE